MPEETKFVREWAVDVNKLREGLSLSPFPSAYLPSLYNALMNNSISLMNLSYKSNPDYKLNLNPSWANACWKWGSIYVCRLFVSDFFIIFCLSQEILRYNVEYVLLWMTETDSKLIVIWYKLRQLQIAWFNKTQWNLQFVQCIYNKYKMTWTGLEVSFPLLVKAWNIMFCIFSWYLLQKYLLLTLRISRD